MDERIPTYMPGDLIEYILVFGCKANVRTVRATFRNQDTGAEVVLAGQAALGEDALRIRYPLRDTRVQKAALYFNTDQSEPPVPGRYHLARLEATTYGGHHLDFDNPPEGEGFYFGEESTENLPYILERGFQPQEGHPNLLPRRS